MWAGSNAFKNSFARLFNLSTEREVSMRDMRKWVHGLLVWRWRWRRELFEIEKHVLNNLVDVINRYSYRNTQRIVGDGRPTLKVVLPQRRHTASLLME